MLSIRADKKFSTIGPWQPDEEGKVRQRWSRQRRTRTRRVTGQGREGLHELRCGLECRRQRWAEQKGQNVSI